MRTLSSPVYKLAEHPSPDACLDSMRQWPDIYGWGDDNVASLRAFCALFNLQRLDYSVSTCGHSWASAEIPDGDPLEELKGVRLWKYINRHFGRHITKDCPFTGYCMDEAVLQPLRQWLARPGLTTDFEDLVRDCLRAWVSAYVADWESAYSDDALRDMAEANEYEFYENGRLV
jgi:hypothetical protein